MPANLTELGIYNITVVVNDTSGNTNTSTSSFEVFEYKWYDNRTDPSGIVYYFSDADYQFNVSWNLTIDTVYFEHNFTGTLQNYTATGNVSQEFYYNYTNIQPGSYVWKSLANDTSVRGLADAINRATQLPAETITTEAVQTIHDKFSIETIVEQEKELFESLML